MSFRSLITWLAAVACFATAAAVPATYIYGIDHVTIGVLTIPLIKSGLVVAWVYAGLNIMSALAGQGGNDPLYWLDYLASWVAWLFINLTAVYVAIGMKESYQNITEVTQVPFALWLLGGLVLFSWVDVLFLQRHKHRRAWEEAQVQRAVAPAAPLAPAAPAVAPVAPAPAESHAGGVFAVIILLIIAGILAFALFGGNLSILGDKGCSFRSEYVTTNNGVREYKTIPIDCD